MTTDFSLIIDWLLAAQEPWVVYNTLIDLTGANADSAPARKAYQALQKHPRVRGQALHVPPLTLGVKRVEHQARLARSRNAGDDNQAVARQIERDVFEVVGARAADADGALDAAQGSALTPLNER